jgi:hypothetical protein
MPQHEAMGTPAADRGLADRAFRQLRGWPALTVCIAHNGAGKGLALRTRQIVHLHDQDQAEVYLTRPVVQRMAEVLSESGRVTMEPGDEWVRVRLDSPSDVTLLASLVSVAIKANAPAMGTPHRAIGPCPRARATAAWR